MVELYGSALTKALSPDVLNVPQFYQRREHPRLYNSITQHVVTKLYGKVFVIRIRVWKAGRWRGEILVRGNDFDNTRGQTKLTTQAKHYKFINFEAVTSWFKSDWQQDWVQDFNELTQWCYVDELGG